jgi:hypothetical protein
MKKTILILGDSWGVPDYTTAFQRRKDQFQFSIEDHVENRLRDYGYKVINCSLNGQNNLKTLKLAQMYMDGEACLLEPVKDYIHNDKIMTPHSNAIIRDDSIKKIDVILWFHTALFRNDTQQGLTYKENLENIADEIYKKYSDFFKEQDAKAFIIGGQGPCITEILKKYIDPYFYIEDWRSDLVGQKLPEFNAFGSWDFIKNHIRLTDQEITYFDHVEQLYRDTMIKSNKFFDGCHPGKEAHSWLAKTIHKSLMEDYL